MNNRLPPDTRLQNKLRTALKYAKVTCVLGTSNRIDDITKTCGWSAQQYVLQNLPGVYLNCRQTEFDIFTDGEFNVHVNAEDHSVSHPVTQWYYHLDHRTALKNVKLSIIPRTTLAPATDSQFNLSTSSEMLLSGAQLALTSRFGNCGELSQLITKYLWENPQGIDRIEGVRMGIDHGFVVINRCGELRQPATWGDAWIIDAWYQEGVIYHASELPKILPKIRQYAKEQTKSCHKIGMNNGIFYNRAPDIDKTEWDICPLSDKYPHYEPHMNIEDYYTIPGHQHQNSIEIFAKHKNAHRQTYAPSLNAIRLFKQHTESESTLNDKAAVIRVTHSL